MKNLFAVSDLHVQYPENRRIAEELQPESDDDWLLVAGDVGEMTADIIDTMKILRDRFGTVVWAPGNHELWTPPGDPVQLRGEARYLYLVDVMRDMGVLTPEDPYPLWEGPAGPVAVAPLFVLYDYTFRPPGTRTKEEALNAAYQAGVVCSDEYLLHSDPYPSRDAWCRARLEYTRGRLDAIDPALPTILVNHFPLVREPTRILRYPEFAQWCGTEETADWHVRYRAVSVIYGHLHIPRTIECDGVPHREVSLGYPREWRRRPAPPQGLARIVPASVMESSA
ncbi:metallophosphoesterase [Streptomyces sp. ISL-99]|uniref:metallophosphoesterase family protein n=1 Tax=Streptomyces sp. ISL-99 TaxID=2819193 RepID=UPI001BE69189|nr:metallophosphoesterase [Streptomyces sp. ISL-99]MBT2526242.1 metallophosphoesterase [Streptomyces sp. ISL-99]